MVRDLKFKKKYLSIVTAKIHSHILINRWKCIKSNEAQLVYGKEDSKILIDITNKESKITFNSSSSKLAEDMLIEVYSIFASQEELLEEIPINDLSQEMINMFNSAPKKKDFELFFAKMLNKILHDLKVFPKDEQPKLLVDIFLVSGTYTLNNKERVKKTIQSLFEGNIVREETGLFVIEVSLDSLSRFLYELEELKENEPELVTGKLFLFPNGETSTVYFEDLRFAENAVLDMREIIEILHRLPSSVSNKYIGKIKLVVEELIKNKEEAKKIIYSLNYLKS